MRAIRCFSALLVISVLVSASSQTVFSATVLVLSTGNATEDMAIENVLESFGHSVDLGPQYHFFNGNPGLADYDSVILLPNYNWSTFPLIMSLSGQTQLLDYINAGGGLVTGEWTIWKSGAEGEFRILREAFPVERTLSYRNPSQVTYSQVTPNARLNAGLPESFTFSATSISFSSESRFIPKPGATVFYGSDYPVPAPNSGSGLIGWDYGAGRVISFSTTIALQELADANYTRLLSNAVSWSVVPEPSSLVMMAVGLSLLLVWRHARAT